MLRENVLCKDTNSFFHSIEENGITLQQESFNFGAAFHFWNENPFERIFIFTDKVFKYLDTRFYNEVEGSSIISTSEYFFRAKKVVDINDPEVNAKNMFIIWSLKPISIIQIKEYERKLLLVLSAFDNEYLKILCVLLIWLWFLTSQYHLKISTYWYT